MESVEIKRGFSPVILGLPHTGTYVPPTVWGRLNEQGQALADTDWHIDQLYDGLLPEATTVRATFHRYVIDVNRDTANVSLYPGQNTTDLIPATDFDGVPIWNEGQEPTEKDIAERTRDFHAPYHDALRAEIHRVRAIHGLAVVYDCHSIRSHIPFLFAGTLPDLNIGTNSGRSCDARLEASVSRMVSRVKDYTHAFNGRFKGGWTTRHHGRPHDNVHAIQMELAQSTYLETESAPFRYHEAKAARIRAYLGEILRTIETFANETKDQSLEGATQ